MNNYPIPSSVKTLLDRVGFLVPEYQKIIVEGDGVIDSDSIAKWLRHSPTMKRFVEIGAASGYLESPAKINYEKKTIEVSRDFFEKEKTLKERMWQLLRS